MSHLDIQLVEIREVNIFVLYQVSVTFIFSEILLQ